MSKSWFESVRDRLKLGQEHPDPTPIAIPLGFGSPEALPDMVKRLTGAALRTQRGFEDVEGFDEADDFEVEDGFPLSPYDEKFDPTFAGTVAQEQRAGLRGPRPTPPPGRPASPPPPAPGGPAPGPGPVPPEPNGVPVAQLAKNLGVSEEALSAFLKARTVAP